MPLSYAIIGTGALGGLYGALLERAGCQVHFLLHSEYEHVREHGLEVDSIWGRFTLRPAHVYAAADQMPRCDVVCVCLKTSANDLLPDILPHVTRAGSAVLLMQNGLGAEEEVAAQFPALQVGGGLCYLCCGRTGPGRIHHTDQGRIIFAAFSSGMEAVLQQIMADFQRAGVPVELAADLKRARWKKLVWNIPYNGLSVALQAGTDEIMRHPATAGLARGLMLEVLAGARACGCPLDPACVDQMCEFTRKLKPYLPSMALDFQAGRPLEIEYLYRRPLRAAQEAGQSLPRVEMLASVLEFLDERNRLLNRQGRQGAKLSNRQGAKTPRKK